MTKIIKDFSLSSFVAGLIVILVGMTSSAVLVFQAAQASGATIEQASSWLGALCIGMGLLGAFFSFVTRTPVLFSWSTPGAALIIAGGSAFTINQMVGSFLLSAALLFLSGATGIFEKIMKKIPISLCSALLAGVLLHFSVDAFTKISSHPVLLSIMLVTFICCKKWVPRYVMLFVVLVGMLVAFGLNLLHFNEVKFEFTHFEFFRPELNFLCLLSIGIPLFVVTMASQNLTGLSMMMNYDYKPKTSVLIATSGAMNIITSVFGGFTINLAAITAAIAMSPESHPDPSKRYIAGLVSSVGYIVIGLFAGIVTSVFAAFPLEMIIAISGLALISTLLSSLDKALENKADREAAFITFLVAASGLSLFGVGSAFWAIVIGLLVRKFFH